MQTFFTEALFADITIIFDIEFGGIQWLFKFSTLRDPSPSSSLLITLEIIILHYRRESLMKVLQFRILSSSIKEDLFIHLFCARAFL